MTKKSKRRPFEKLALDLLKQAKELLLANKSFTPTIFLVYPSDIKIFEIPFNTPQEKIAGFEKAVDLAVRTNADAIISIADQYVRKLPTTIKKESLLERHCEGSLEAEPASEELGMIVSPRDHDDWGLSVPYLRAEDAGTIVYARARSNTRAPYVNNLFPASWKTAAKARADKRKRL